MVLLCVLLAWTACALAAASGRAIRPVPIIDPDAVIARLGHIRRRRRVRDAVPKPMREQTGRSDYVHELAIEFPSSNIKALGVQDKGTGRNHVSNHFDFSFFPSAETVKDWLGFGGTYICWDPWTQVIDFGKGSAL